MTATPDNIKITKGSAQVIIGLTRVTENWTKALILITEPKSTDNQGINEGKSPTNFVDLLRNAEHRLTIDGYISTSMTNRAAEGSKNKAGAAITDATDMLNTMREIFFAGGTFTMVVHGTSYTVNSDKFESRWAVNDKDTITSYDIKFTVIVGEDLV